MIMPVLRTSSLFLTADHDLTVVAISERLFEPHQSQV